jgi:prophage regulatory protein
MVTVLRRRQVQAKTGLPTTSLYRLISRGQFPRPIMLGVKSVGWLSTEVDDWLRSRVENRDAHAAPLEMGGAS